MEKWQTKHIINNLAELVSLTVFNSQIEAELLTECIFANADIKSLAAERDEYKRSSKCYEMLMGRTNAYKVLTKVLIKYNQTGAARLLIRVPAELCTHPLKFLNISINCHDFQDTEIYVHGKPFKIKEFFPKANYKMLQEIFQDNISELDFYDSFITKQKTYVLAINTVPTIDYYYYIPRFLSNKTILHEWVFKEDRNDVFVFKNTIARTQVYDIAKPHFTASSSSQLTCVTSRFIYLEDNEDWIDLKLSAKVPIHLINYKAGSFILEDSSMTSDFLMKLGSKDESVYISESDFVEQQFSDDSRVASIIYICGTPGTGKASLLANIASTMVENWNDRIIAYIPLDKFLGQLSTNTLNYEATFLDVLKYITPSNSSSSDNNAKLLLSLVKNKRPMEVFFDGIDKIPSDEAEWIIKFITIVPIEFPEVRMYITSKPHMKKQLEKSLNVIAYDMLPFKHQNQVDFLVKFWFHKRPTRNRALLEKYATSCLKSVNKSIVHDKEITEIPLLIKLLAEAYDKNPKRSVNSNLFTLVKMFIDKRISGTDAIEPKNEQKCNQLELLHIAHALQHCFPTDSFHHADQFKDVKHLMKSSEILKYGIFQKYQHAELKFVHIAVAKYLSVKYFCTKLQNQEALKAEEPNCSRILFLLLECERIPENINEMPSKAKTSQNFSYSFSDTTITSFFDSALEEMQQKRSPISLSLEPGTHIAKFITKILPKQIFAVLYACCQHNFNSIFSLIMEALTNCDSKWIRQYFTTANSFKLFSCCIKWPTSVVFQRCVSLFTKVLKLDMTQIETYCDTDTLLQLAVKYLNDGAVMYLVERVPLKNQNILKICVETSYNDSLDIHKRENILKFLLKKDPSLIDETPDILVHKNIHLSLIKILVQFGAKLTSVGDDNITCVTNAADYMLPMDYHEFIQYILTDCEAECLFHQNDKWIDPLPRIIEKGKILPETLQLLHSIPGIKNRYGENLVTPIHRVSLKNHNNLQTCVDTVSMNAPDSGRKEGQKLELAPNNPTSNNGTLVNDVELKNDRTNLKINKIDQMDDPKKVPVDNNSLHLFTYHKGESRQEPDYTSTSTTKTEQITPFLSIPSDSASLSQKCDQGMMQSETAISHQHQGATSSVKTFSRFVADSNIGKPTTFNDSNSTNQKNSEDKQFPPVSPEALLTSKATEETFARKSSIDSNSTSSSCVNRKIPLNSKRFPKSRNARNSKNQRSRMFFSSSQHLKLKSTDMKQGHLFPSNFSQPNHAHHHTSKITEKSRSGARNKRSKMRSYSRQGSELDSISNHMGHSSSSTSSFNYKEWNFKGRRSRSFLNNSKAKYNRERRSKSCSQTQFTVILFFIFLILLLFILILMLFLLILMFLRSSSSQK